MQPPKYDPENPNPYPARIYTMDEVKAMGFDVPESKAPDAPKPKSNWLEPGTLEGPRPKLTSFVAHVDPETHKRYKKRLIEIGISNSAFFEYLLDMEDKHLELLYVLGGEPKITHKGDFIGITWSDGHECYTYKRAKTDEAYSKMLQEDARSYMDFVCSVEGTPTVSPDRSTITVKLLDSSAGEATVTYKRVDD